MRVRDLDGATLLWLMDYDAPPFLVPLSEQILNRPAWHAQAACRGMGPDPFFAGRGEAHRAALAVCASCPVRVECGEAAMADPTTVGVWGGMNDQDRERARRGAA